MSHQELIGLAETIATEAHAGQFRRGGIVPYIEHPKAVVSRVGSDPEAQIVAWLHDVIEDSQHTKETLHEAGIPSHLVSAVDLLTKTPGCTYENYLERIAASPLATKVKIADMLSNLADSPTKKQIRKYADGLLRLTRDNGKTKQTDDAMNLNELLNVGKNTLVNEGHKRVQQALDEGFVVRTDAGDYFVGNVNGELEHHKIETGADRQTWDRPLKLDQRRRLPDLQFPLRIPYSTLGFMGPLSGSAGDLIIHQEGRFEFDTMIVS